MPIDWITLKSPNQNRYFRANWKIRGLPADRIFPKFRLSSRASGPEKFTWFQALKASARNWTRPARSEITKFLTSDRSVPDCPGPLNRFRPAEPYLPGRFGVNA